MSQEALMQFQQIIFDDAKLQAELREITDEQEFIEKVLKLGKERDLELTTEDLSNALQTSRRAWLERWLG